MKKTAESVLKSARENNEPVLVLRAKDECSLHAISRYIVACTLKGCDENHIIGLVEIEKDFENYKLQNPDKMKLPD